MWDLTFKAKKWNSQTYQYSDPAVVDADYTRSEDIITIKHKETGTIYKEAINLPAGTYQIYIETTVTNITGLEGEKIYVEYALENIKLSQTRFTDASEEWKPTFDIWIKNIWQTEKLEGETDQEYADRVWLPILGTDGQETMVTFSRVGLHRVRIGSLRLSKAVMLMTPRNHTTECHRIGNSHLRKRMPN
jgi:hypothetical protein